MALAWALSVEISFCALTCPRIFCGVPGASGEGPGGSVPAVPFCDRFATVTRRRVPRPMPRRPLPIPRPLPMLMRIPPLVLTLGRSVLPQRRDFMSRIPIFVAICPVFKSALHHRGFRFFYLPLVHRTGTSVPFPRRCGTGRTTWKKESSVGQPSGQERIQHIIYSAGHKRYDFNSRSCHDAGQGP